MWQRALIRRPVLDGDLEAWATVADSQPSPEQALEQQETARRLAEALADLPPSERNALLLVYHDGLSHQQTAARLGASLSAVKVRVHRGRGRLRTTLGPVYDGRPPTADRQGVYGSQPSAVGGQLDEETTMIPVTIHDVLANVSPLDHRPLLEPYFAVLPEEKREQLWPRLAVLMVPREPFALGMFYHRDLVEDLSPEQRETMQAAVSGLLPHRIVLLKEREGQRALPIWVGPGEGDAIAVRLRNQELPRPLGVDLTTTLLSLGGVRVMQATVSRLHETVFYATLSVETEEETAEVDCRPSDALSLAVRLDVPIYVAPEVLDEAGVVPDEDGRYPVGRERGSNLEWYSLLH
jgi:bifunctional DNase/RNase